jgi:hypothetical protein
MKNCRSQAKGHSNIGSRMLCRENSKSPTKKTWIISHRKKLKISKIDENGYSRMKRQTISLMTTRRNQKNHRKLPPLDNCHSSKCRSRTPPSVRGTDFRPKNPTVPTREPPSGTPVPVTKLTTLPITNPRTVPEPHTNAQNQHDLHNLPKT